MRARGIWWTGQSGSSQGCSRGQEGMRERRIRFDTAARSFCRAAALVKKMTKSDFPAPYAGGIAWPGDRTMPASQPARLDVQRFPCDALNVQLMRLRLRPQ